MDRTPYTYLVGWSNLNKWYYGRRTAKGCSPSDLWVKYFTSSKEVIKFRELNGEPDVIEIRKVFSNADSCKKWESKVLRRIDAQHNESFLNKKNGDENWDTTGRTDLGKYERTEEIRLSMSKFRLGKANAFNSITGEFIGLISTSDPRWETGEIYGNTKNMRHSETSKQKMSNHRLGVKMPNGFGDKISNALSGKPKTEEHKNKMKESRLRLIESGWSYSHTEDTKEKLRKPNNKNKGLAAAKDAKTGELLGKIKIDDPRWETGEIVGVLKGIPSTNSSSFKKNSASAKTNTGIPLGNVSLDDPRWETGEIVGIRKVIQSTSVSE
jgi:hypothetical protein